METENIKLANKRRLKTSSKASKVYEVQSNEEALT